MERRLLTHRRPGDGSRRVGRSRDGRISGIPRRYGLENWSKKLRFMVRFRERVLLLQFCSWGCLWG